MGWEMLPPEEPIWVSRCCPKSCIEERAALRARVAELEDEINNPKMTYCVYCGKEFDIGDRDEATKLVVEHIYTCEKHPLSSYITRVAELEAKLDALVAATSKAYSDWDGGSPEESLKSMRELKAAIAAAEGR